MTNCSQPDLCISGLGVTSAIGQGQAAFSKALLQGDHAFGVMKRPGRQRPESVTSDDSLAFLGAEIESLDIPERVPKSVLRTTSFSAHVGVTTLHEAWLDANLDDVDPARIGLVVGGSNFQQRELVQTYDRYREKVNFLRPTYGMSFLDSDLCGLTTEVFGIRGPAFTLGGASASGQVAILQAAQAVQSGSVDVCLAMGALMDLSYWECQGFRSMGAMGSNAFAHAPALACRPFDRERDGFIYGESCGVVVIERQNQITRSKVKPYARLAGMSMLMDGNRNPDPSPDGETAVITDALAHAGFAAHDIDYINPHGTGSPIGDETELQALLRCELSHAFINTTKSVIGHGLSAAGAVEIIATLVQMRAGTLHPSRNLDNPISNDFNWVRDLPVTHQVQRSVNLSMGFGGLNTAICMQRL